MCFLHGPIFFTQQKSDFFFGHEKLLFFLSHQLSSHGKR
jgi:hypothetical protein